MSAVVNLRPATMDDARFLWEWRNDPTVREMSFNSDEIAYADHVSWLEGALADPEVRIWIGEVGGQPVGQIRYGRDLLGCEISFSVASEHRRKGYGVELLKTSRNRAFQEIGCGRVYGLVLPQNKAAHKAFQGAGFQWTEPEPGQPTGYRWPA